MSSFSLVLTVLYRYEYERSGKPMQESTFTKNICLDFSSQKFIVTLKIMKRKELFVRGSQNFHYSHTYLVVTKQENIFWTPKIVYCISKNRFVIYFSQFIIYLLSSKSPLSGFPLSHQPTVFVLFRSTYL